MNNKQSPAELVKEYYPNAVVVQVGTKQNYEVRSADKYLGKGSSRKAAWKSAYRNIYGHH